jgi:hypothetical protein
MFSLKETDANICETESRISPFVSKLLQACLKYGRHFMYVNTLFMKSRRPKRLPYIAYLQMSQEKLKLIGLRAGNSGVCRNCLNNVQDSKSVPFRRLRVIQNFKPWQNKMCVLIESDVNMVEKTIHLK